jgi:uncharacterized protein YjiS (DUF1127 family)
MLIMIAQFIEPIRYKIAPHRFVSGASQRLNQIRRWWRYRRTVQELSRLDSHMLKDLGIQRSEITYVAQVATVGEDWRYGN